MAVTAETVMQECRNFFETGYVDGVFAIQGGRMPDSVPALTGQYIAITGSMLNDGVHVFGDGSFLDETFAGRVWLLRPPRAFIDLCGEIAEFDAKSPVTGLQSESFAGYSYARATGQNGAVLGWKEIFAQRLAPYRRMFKGVPL